MTQPQDPAQRHNPSARQDPAQPHHPAAPDIRIGHAEREVTVNRLHSAFAEGRLDVTEFDERVASAYAARTAGELSPLTADLPSTGAHQPTRPEPTPSMSLAKPEPHEPELRTRRHDPGAAALKWAWRAWAAAVSINLVVWTLVSLGMGDPHYFWPMWVAGPWGAVLVVGTLFRGADRPPQS